MLPKITLPRSPQEWTAMMIKSPMGVDRFLASLIGDCSSTEEWVDLATEWLFDNWEWLYRLGLVEPASSDTIRLTKKYSWCLRNRHLARWRQIYAGLQ